MSIRLHFCNLTTQLALVIKRYYTLQRKYKLELNGRGVTRESAMNITLNFFNLSTQLDPVIKRFFASEEIQIGIKWKRSYKRIRHEHYIALLQSKCPARPCPQALYTSLKSKQTLEANFIGI